MFPWISFLTGENAAEPRRSVLMDQHLLEDWNWGRITKECCERFSSIEEVGGVYGVVIGFVDWDIDE